jgi:uncharacterized protein (DUF1330 family)
MKSRLLLLAAALFASSFLASVAHATVLRVIMVKTDDPAAYVKQIEQGQALLKKMGSTTVIRVWQARYAGSDTGAVVVSIEYPDMVAFAADGQKLSADPEYMAWLKGLNKVRTITSDSLFEELTP